MRHENEPSREEQDAMERLQRRGVRVDINIDAMTVVVFELPEKVDKIMLRRGMQKILPDIRHDQWQIIENRVIEHRAIFNKFDIKKLSNEEIIALLRKISGRAREAMSERGTELDAEGNVMDQGLLFKSGPLPADGEALCEQWLKDL